ncbi:MAG: hypothetical protein LBU37_09870, partial [Tannerellaceae bacterium]|nr:hypothetical protein [Tannerellaceae bacterium]
MNYPFPEKITGKKEGSSLFRDEPPVRCRLILSELGNGQKEVLCISPVDSTQYPRELFSELYHCRRGIEEGYKLLKEHLDLEDFSGKTAKAVKEDFHAKILIMTLCAALSFPIEEKVRSESLEEKTGNKRKHERKINRTSALDMFYEIAIGIFIKKDFKNA